MVFVLLVALALRLSSVQAGKVCLCDQEAGSMCYYNPAAGISVPSDLWTCDTINGTLQVDITAAEMTNTQTFHTSWVFGDIEFYSSSLAPSKTTIYFPFLYGIQGSMRFNFPDD